MSTESSESFALGALSNRHAEFQTQSILRIDEDGRLRHSFISPRSLTVPPEILAEIFIQCLPVDDDDCFITVTPDLSTAPLVLCGICRRWREVALSARALWGSVFLDFDAMLINEAYVELYWRWFARARGTALSLHFQDMKEKRTSMGHIDSLLIMVIGLSPQWRKLKLNIGVDLANFLFPIEPGKLSLLEELSITLLPSDLHIYICDTPRLRQVSIPIYNPRIQVPWCQLTTFRSGDIDISSLLDVLRNCSNLLDGSFESLALHGPLEEDGISIPIPILDCLETPGLQSLTLKFTKHGTRPAADISPFLSFLSRSSAQLHTLALSAMPATSESLIDCLKAAPSLVHFRLEPALHLVDMDSIFAQFSGFPDFLPNLESFYIVFPVGNGSLNVPCLTATIVVEMLCWRWAAGEITRLRSFRLAHHRWRFGQDILAHPEFQRLEKEGMVLHVGKSERQDDGKILLHVKTNVFAMRSLCLAMLRVRVETVKIVF
ncbi:hypothetical protein DFH06DRAFT_49692 [Mycena polygramma]|nr:hypothetical protein DFH06DRAFT_49692 [Mycena polygramma]